MRLDVALVARGLARSRNQGATLVRQGRVTVDGVVISKPSHRVTEAASPLAWMDAASVTRWD